MNPPSDNSAHTETLARSLAFFGAVVASVSHEMNNVVSIVDQNAGLVEDMIAGEKHGVPLSIDRLGQAVGSVRRQTGRGLDLVRRLNRFAHSADESLVEFDVNQVLENLVSLSARLAGLKRAQLVFNPEPSPLLLRGNPFLLQQVVFGVFQAALDTVERDDRIEITAEAKGAGLGIAVAWPRRLETDRAINNLKTIAALMDADLDAKMEENRTEVNLVLGGASSATG